MQTFNPSEGVPGFAFSAGLARIKKKSGSDIGLIVADRPCVAAGVFTKNRVQAAPVMLCRELLRTGRAQAIIVNSGNANACTGSRGVRDARAICTRVAAELGINQRLVLPASTGVIGVPLPVAKIMRTIPGLVRHASSETAPAVAAAIMTTDTFPKTVALTETIAGKPVKVLGIAKGAGMIMPDMATMLAFILTDAALPAALLRRLVRQHAAATFNCITVDGDMSTNDSLIVLASGASAVRIAGANTASGKVFSRLLHDVMLQLARMIVRDGEGATKLITIRVEHARSAVEAKKAAMAVANSCLVKTAFFGEDFNWGRIMAALGRSGAVFSMDRVEISFNRIRAVCNGQGVKNVAPRIRKVLAGREIEVGIDLKQGKYHGRVMTCDLSCDYVKINADYTT